MTSDDSIWLWHLIVESNYGFWLLRLTTKLQELQHRGWSQYDIECQDQNTTWSVTADSDFSVWQQDMTSHYGIQKRTINCITQIYLTHQSTTSSNCRNRLCFKVWHVLATLSHLQFDWINMKWKRWRKIVTSNDDFKYDIRFCHPNINLQSTSKSDLWLSHQNMTSACDIRIWHEKEI